MAIRGGVPLCYPWFGGVKKPSHGTARLRLWQLSDYDLQANKVRLEFSLFSEYGVIEAKMKMEFTDKCTMTLTHLGQEPAQAALHSYFNIGCGGQAAGDVLGAQVQIASAKSLL